MASVCAAPVVVSAHVTRAAGRRSALPQVQGLKANALRLGRPAFSSVSVSPISQNRGALQTRNAMEVAQIAGVAAEIGGTAAVMFAVTLVGLALGFVLLRVESIVDPE